MNIFSAVAPFPLLPLVGHAGFAKRRPALHQATQQHRDLIYFTCQIFRLFFVGLFSLSAK